MFDSKMCTSVLAAGLAFAALSFSPVAFADSGFFLGANVGNSSVSAEVEDPGGGGDISFDEGDFSWKVYGGFAFDLPLIDFGVELGYFDLGGPSVDALGDELSIDVSGLSVFGLAGVNLGPVGVFAKAGVASWDAELALAGLSASEDGSDPAYGVGLRFTLGSLEIRGEYEVIDIDDVDDVYMASAGVVWRF
ncbi:MAG: outer membrane beta-barrel protein [Gammaproteobacteria bacterium]|nr:outer membrane beta-barrel protein [Gammaproteobacteria bacterium]MDH5305287.1 outer membrane beta-barrel protein [Gammaproteobacteria bacterium]MDH5323510.1 outer membrane beta-barrel protein [Gammaproteobacteria bacterium]